MVLSTTTSAELGRGGCDGDGGEEEEDEFEKSDCELSTSGVDDEKYMTYQDIYDNEGDWIAVRGVDSCAPKDAAFNKAIPFKEIKDDNGNIVNRIYSAEYRTI